MGEKLNSGLGGYTCEGPNCSKLLWAGHVGSSKPENRRFIYGSTEKSIVRAHRFYYCSEKCLNEDHNAGLKENSNVENTDEHSGAPEAGTSAGPRET